MDVRASIVSELNGPWHTETIEIDEPHANEVRVKVAFSGLCHSDEHLRTGALGNAPEVLEMISGRPSMYPIIGGHEGSGVVDAVGEGVTSVKPAITWRRRSFPRAGSANTASPGDRTSATWPPARSPVR